MRRICQEEMISQLFQENQMRHREIMSIITNQALDAILAQQVIEQIFAFVPASTRTDSQCPQEQVSQRRLPRIIFGSRHRQYRVPPSPYHTGLACRLISEVANAHRFAGARLGHNRSEEHTSELQSHSDLVCRLLLEKKKIVDPNCYC